jgi:lysophospholipase L1-like esterase
MLKSILQDIATIDEEILIVAKKAGFFEVNSDFLNNVQKYIDPSNPIYNDYKYELLNM